MEDTSKKMKVILRLLMISQEKKDLLETFSFTIPKDSSRKKIPIFLFSILKFHGPMVI